MNILTTRRICQIFFLLVFLWFCVVSTLGQQWYQLRGWPVNWILQLDPLVGLGTLLTTRTLYAGLIWGLATLTLTILLGRFFCGWVCPFGTLHQCIGFLGKRKKSMAARLKINRYHPGQAIKYWILIFFLTIAAAKLAIDLILMPRTHTWFFGILVLGVLAALIVLALRQYPIMPRKAIVWFLIAAVGWLLLSLIFQDKRTPFAALQIGLLDPIPLLYRSINLIILPLSDRTALKISTVPRYYDGTGLIATIFVLALLLNLIIPRFYCRFVCPLGALLGIFSRYSLWRIGKNREACIDCHVCEKNCEGACEPSGQIRISECVLCLNCLQDCHHDLMGYHTTPSAIGEIVSPDLSRRQFVVAALSGAVAIPMLRLDGNLGPNWNPRFVRPPGALEEKEFLSRCIKCGQCMRVCPTNVIHPAGLEAGLEALWTPVLNFRIGTSGCQFNCIACGNLCPTAAIRPIRIDERLGINAFTEQGPIKIGTAFIDRGRCLPWSMDRPCIVCQENCPVSPKAIFTRVYFNTLKINPALTIDRADSLYLEFQTYGLAPERYATGDYYCVVSDSFDRRPRRIVSNSERGLKVSADLPFEPTPQPGSRVEIQVRLQQPYVDPERCIGCGICEHECPVSGKRAIRVTADGESRAREHSMLLKTDNR